MMNGRYEIPLVIISVLVAILASYTALSLAGRVTKSHGNVARWWIAGGALAMGTGIWSMHFIGMLAFRLPIPVGYDWWITLLSLMLPIAVSAMALSYVSQPQLPVKRLLFGALLMGIGINGMHYTGIAAMRMYPGIVYDPLLFTASAVIAVTASGAALSMAFRLRGDIPNVWMPRLGAAVIMGFAIAGMHYTGMAAAHFPEGSICMAASSGFSQNGLAVMVIIATLGVLTVAMLTSVYDARLESRSQVLAISEATAEERLVLLARERVARAEAEQMSAMKDEFLATLSHELRTPLNSILGWAHILRHGIKNEATLYKGLDTIERNARAQAQLIDDLLDMSRIISGKIRLDVRPVDPTTFIEDALETIRPAAAVKNILLETVLKPDAGLISGDPARLQQVMWNLLSNAVKFTPNGGKVQITLDKAGDSIEIRVADSGSGISADFLPYVFDRFRQADASTTRQYGGLGLGLSIVKNLVELHGGSVWVTSKGEGQGVSVVVHLPLPQKHTVTKEDGSVDSQTIGSGSREFRHISLSGITVLVVDDEADALDLIGHILAECGAIILKASSAHQALGFVKNESPDIIVSDIGMPNVDGFELMRWVRALQKARGRETPALALTAFTRLEDQKRSLDAGFTHYMSKPVEPSELVFNVASMMGRADTTTQSLPSDEKPLF